MRRNSSYADFLTDWQHLLATVNAIPELSGSRYKADLENILTQIGQATIRQAQHQAAKQSASLEVQQLVSNGKDTARDLTAEMKAHFGTRSEDLVQFRVLPLRRSRRAKPRVQETPPTGGATSETPTPAPVSGTQPITKA